MTFDEGSLLHSSADVDEPPACTYTYRGRTTKEGLPVYEVEA